MTRLTNFVISHVKIEEKLPKNYVPIYVGSAPINSNFHHEKKGENIANLNSCFCELTGFYYVWKNILNGKNLEKTDFISFNHFRRYFINETLELKRKNGPESYIKFSDLNKYGLKDVSFESDVGISKKWHCKATIKNSIKSILKGFVLLPGFKFNLCQQYKLYHNEKDLLNFIDCLSTKFKLDFANYLQSESCYSPYNMFIARVDISEEYFTSLFKIMFEFYAKTNEQARNQYQSRYIGFIAERFTSFYFNQMNHVELDVGFVE